MKHRADGEVNQTPPAAREFYSRKVEELGRNLQDLEKIVQGKQGNLSVVEDGEFLGSFGRTLKGGRLGGGKACCDMG